MFDDIPRCLLIALAMAAVISALIVFVLRRRPDEPWRSWKGELQVAGEHGTWPVSCAVLLASDGAAKVSLSFVPSGQAMVLAYLPVFVFESEGGLVERDTYDFDAYIVLDDDENQTVIGEPVEVRWRPRRLLLECYLRWNGTDTMEAALLPEAKDGEVETWTVLVEQPRKPAFRIPAVPFLPEPPLH